MAAETIAIVGESGTGKSTSLRNLNPEETFIISTTGKPLPFRGWKRKYAPIKISAEGISGKVPGGHCKGRITESRRAFSCFFA